MNKSYIFLAAGFEEIEAMTTIDILRRAEINVVTVSISDSLQVKGAHNITVEADILFSEIDFANIGWLILPGGMPGATNLSAFKPLTDLLKLHNSKGGNIAAICASPAVVLSPLGILDGKDATCYPGFEMLMPKATKSILPIVVSKKIITANGPSSSMQFALAIVSATKGEAVAVKIAAGLLLYTEQHEYYF